MDSTLLDFLDGRVNGDLSPIPLTDKHAISSSTDLGLIISKLGKVISNGIRRQDVKLAMTGTE
jgi:hypothetical protein